MCKNKIKQLEIEIERLKRKISTETMGRIKAEKLLRTGIQEKIANDGYLMKPIGTLRSCFPDRFGTPRQGLLANKTRGLIRIDPNIIGYASIKDLNDYSHAHILSIFHQRTDIHKLLTVRTQSTLVKPPQSDGKKRGVFSTRTPHRPNNIALSIVEIREVDVKKGILYINGVDLIDHTPILDIKPYIPHVDKVLNSVAPDWLLNSKFTPVEVRFTEESLIQLKEAVEQDDFKFYNNKEFNEVKKAIEQTLSLDPRANIHGRGIFKEKEEKQIKETDTDKEIEDKNKINIKENRMNRVVFKMRFDKVDIHFSPNKQGERFIEVVKIEV